MLAWFALLLAGAGAAQPLRTRSEVEARGREVVRAYSDPRLAALGILDASKPPYSADPSGRRDSTRAIEQALEDARDARLAAFLPAGRYRVSGTVTCTQGVVRRDAWPFGDADPIVENESFYFPCVLTGPREGARAVIQLAPGASGFADPKTPKPVLHFWARSETRDRQTRSSFDPAQPQPNISFNQMVLDVDFDLGRNAGAVAIDHQAAQGSAIEDVAIDATGAFAGIQKLPGSGGGVHGIRVIGGRYGIYARGNLQLKGSQPSPVVSGARLTGQTEAAVLYNGRGPLTLVGAEIEGAGIVVEGNPKIGFDGPLNVIDSVIRTQGAPAVASTHPVYLNNVYVSGCAAAVRIGGKDALEGSPRAWMRIREWAGGGTVMVEGKPGAVSRIVRENAAPPPDLAARHAWPRPFPAWRDGVNVKSAPYNAAGDGKTDDTAALERAIAEHPTVFLPKGVYRVSRPLKLKAGTRLIGAGNVLSVITPAPDAPAFLDVLNPAPVIDTADDPEAVTTLAFLEILVPTTLPPAYALRWRAGRRSIVRDVNFERGFWDPDSPGSFTPFIRIEGSGGGRWYNVQQCHWWSQGWFYRHLLVDGTTEPLAIYMFNPEHARSEAMVEIRNAANVDVYSMKAEGNYPAVWMHGSRNVRVFGYGGNGSAWPGWPLFRIEDCHDFLLANVAPNLRPYTPGRWTGLGIGLGPEGWFLVKDAAIAVPSQTPLTLYKRGEPSR